MTIYFSVRAIVLAVLLTVVSLAGGAGRYKPLSGVRQLDQLAGHPQQPGVRAGIVAGVLA